MEDLEVILLVNQHKADLEFDGFARRLSAISAKRKRGNLRAQKMPLLRRITGSRRALRL